MIRLDHFVIHIDDDMGSGFVDGHVSANRIVPELQDLDVGDTIMMSPEYGWTVMDIELHRMLVLLARADFQTGRTFELADRMPDRYLNTSQVYVLEEIDKGTTRFIVRDRMDFNMGPMNVLNYILEPGFFIQESKFMLGVKKRAEALAERLED